MKLRFTEKADGDYAGLPVTIRKAFGKQLRFLLANLVHSH
jgi:mRNA-degrading endonuclease RelE of RelBE toxin-antitoxin system